MGRVFAWDQDKNQKLLKERGLSFEAALPHIEAGDVLAVPGKGKYSHQRQFVLLINNYVYIVPFVEEQDRVFLKTIIPSRKMTRLYLGGGLRNEEV